MGYPSWSDGSTTIIFPVGAEVPLTPKQLISSQLVKEASDLSVQVIDQGPTSALYERTYQGVPLEESLDFIAFYEGPTVNKRGYPLTWTDEDGTARSVRIMALSYTRRPNSDFVFTMLMRLEV